MIIRPANVSHITAALKAQIENALGTVTVDRSEPVNESPARCPWVGIYRSSVQYPSRTLGFGAGMRNQEIELILLAQQAHGTSGERCEELTEDLVRDVISAVLSETTLGGKVQTIGNFDVRYPDYSVTEGNVYMQTAAIYMTAVTVVDAE